MIARPARRGERAVTPATVTGDRSANCQSQAMPEPIGSQPPNGGFALSRAESFFGQLTSRALWNWWAAVLGQAGAARPSLPHQLARRNELLARRIPPCPFRELQSAG